MQVRNRFVLKVKHVVGELFTFLHRTEECRMSADQERHLFVTLIFYTISNNKLCLLQTEGNGETEIVWIDRCGIVIGSGGENDIVITFFGNFKFSVFYKAVARNLVVNTMDRNGFRNSSDIWKQYRRSLCPVGRIFLPHIFLACSSLVGKKLCAKGSAGDRCKFILNRNVHENIPL